MRKERMNNKGFSLVELIIVIAIMAILAAALAPQLMKYIEKSRVSTDATSCSSIESCVNAALANEDAYKEVAKQGTGATATQFTFYLRYDEANKKVKYDGLTLTPSGGSGSTTSAFETELSEALSGLKNPKQTGMESYKVEIEVVKKTVTGAAATTSTVYEIGKIRVETDQKSF